MLYCQLLKWNHIWLAYMIDSWLAVMEAENGIDYHY